MRRVGAKSGHCETEELSYWERGRRSKYRIGWENEERQGTIAFSLEASLGGNCEARRKQDRGNVCKTKTNLREEMIKLEGYFQLLVLKVSPSRGGKVWPPPLDHGPPIPPFVHGKYRSIFFLRGVDTSYRNFSLPSFDLLPLAHSLSFQVHRYSKNLTTRRRIFFPRINGSGEKKEKATREFLTRRLILSSIERKKKKNERDYPFSTEYRYVPRVSPSVSSTSLEQR